MRERSIRLREQLYQRTTHAAVVEELQKRLEGRGTDTAEVIAKRVAKAEFEISKAPHFDHQVINDVLDTAVAETRTIIDNFLAE